MFVFPLDVVNDIMGLRLLPLGAMASNSKARVIHDLNLASAPSMSGVKSDTRLCNSASL